MMEKLTVSNLKLCLEALSREQIAPELTQMQLFLNDETQVEFINAWAKELKHRWASFFSPENPPDLESATATESAMMLRPPPRLFCASVCALQIAQRDCGKNVSSTTGMEQ